MSNDKLLRLYTLFLRVSARRSHFSSTPSDRFVFEVLGCEYQWNRKPG
ncbi:hypothetical protein [Nostoc sp. 'Peltigera membranacea cyanobiont' 232]|nr:hypothetical protein [Nostoc sp. 'Peltigera membranacea cyanobiont' 232]